MKATRKIFSTILSLCLIFSLSLPALAASGEEYGIKEHGFLDDGTEYWVLREAPEVKATRTMRRSYDFSGSISVPYANSTGDNGKTVGYSFTAYPDEYVIVEVETSTNNATVNVGLYYTNGSNSDWITSVSPGDTVVFLLEFPSNECCVKTSTYEEGRIWAHFNLYTSSTNPSDDYIEV